MKLKAISISGQRSKDFVDISYALNHFLNPIHVIKRLIYFDDVDLTD